MKLFEKLRRVAGGEHQTPSPVPVTPSHELAKTAPPTAHTNPAPSTPARPAPKTETGQKVANIIPFPTGREVAGGIGSRKKRLLLVHDGSVSLQQLEACVETLQSDWEPVAAATEALALESLERASFDAMICDCSNNDKQWTAFMNDAARIRPNMLRFLRGVAEGSHPIHGIQGQPPVVLPAELKGEELGDWLNRNLTLSRCLGTEPLQKLIAQMVRLPSLPALYTQVMTELQKPDASVNFVGRIIAKDTAMTAKMLQAVNSPIFGLQRQIVDAADAVLYLGTERTKSFLLTSSMFLHFDKASCPKFSHEKLWHHSLAVGNFARSIVLTERRDGVLADKAFTAALLHDVGKLLLAANVPDIYIKIIEQAETRKVSVAQVERELFSATHAEIGASFLSKWGLPFEILSAIAWHHRPAQSGETEFSLLTAVHAANAIANEKEADAIGLHVSQIDGDYIQQINLEGRPNQWRQLCQVRAKSEDDDPAKKNRQRQEKRGTI